MTGPLRYLSTFSGIEAASVAWEPLHWEPVAFSEINPFASAVLSKRFPQVPNFGDISAFETWPQFDAVNLVVGGSPCQSFSVAGLRRGLRDPRGNLALTFLSLVDRLRPEWVVWENVPGALSSNGGRDFGAFTGALAKLGFGFAYRVLDAQFFGVAQRRRRVFLVANARDWRLAASVLFEPEGGSRNPATGRKQGRIATAASASRPVRPSFWNGEQVTQTIDAVVAKQQMMPEKNRFPAVLVPSRFEAGATEARRLTPKECERLQGFPDDWTAITYRGKPAADAPRFKAIGNSMAVPVMRWIGERIDAVNRAQSVSFDPSAHYLMPARPGPQVERR
jgi:DNA (cytosine-5)-methyltransferase 1